MGKLTAEKVIEAIQGTGGNGSSGGIISTIAKRCGVEWHTAETFIQNHPTVKTAYDAECESILDLCESAVIKNVHLAHETQRNGTPGDTSDAKWILSRKGKKRGWGESLEVGGPKGGPIEVIVKGYTTVTPDDWDQDQDTPNRNV